MARHWHWRTPCPIRGPLIFAVALILAACGGATTPTAAPSAQRDATRASAAPAGATAIAPTVRLATPGTPRPPSSATPQLQSSARAAMSAVPVEGTPRSIAAAGELVSVGARRLWIACEGQGAPTVVMDAGVNSGSAVWTLVRPGIARFARVCVYDRAGLGRSDPIPRPRTSQEIVDDLHGLLTSAGLAPPYVLVAHSFGGLNMRLYAAQFPQEVVGMVLVDTVHEDRFARTAAVLNPTQEREFERGRQANPEGLDYFESSRLVRALGRSLPNVPLVVIARGRGEHWPAGWPAEALEQVWRDLQSDLAARAPQGTLIVAERSDHNILSQQPEIIVDATRKVVENARRR